MLEHDGELDIATTFEQHFGTLAIDLDDLSQLRNCDKFPALITGFPDVDSLGDFDHHLAIAIAEGPDTALAEKVESGRGETFDSLVAFLSDSQVTAFAAIRDQVTKPRLNDKYYVQTKYLLGIRAINDTGDTLYLTTPRTLTYYPRERFAPYTSGYQARPSFSAILNGLAKKS